MYRVKIGQEYREFTFVFDNIELIKEEEEENEND